MLDSQCQNDSNDIFPEFSKHIYSQSMWLSICEIAKAYSMYDIKKQKFLCATYFPTDNDNDNDKQFIFRHVCPYNIKWDIHYVQC